MNVTAVAVALHATYTYSTSGANFAVGKFRVADGHAAFLFAFLILTSLFLQRRTVVNYAAAMLGLLGMVFINHRSAYLALFAVSVPLVLHFRRASARLFVVTRRGDLVCPTRRLSQLSPCERASTTRYVRW